MSGTSRFVSLIFNVTGVVINNSALHEVETSNPGEIPWHGLWFYSWLMALLQFNRANSCIRYILSSTI